MSGRVERVEWSDFIENHFEWFQGEHVGLIGPTGCGKTTLAIALLPYRKHVTVFGTKPKDSTLTALVRKGWDKIQDWDDKPEPQNKWQNNEPSRIVLWPKFVTMADQEFHSEIFQEALADMFARGSWTCFVDEVRYIAKNLGLQRELEFWWLQGRSIGLSIIAASQRPVWVPREMVNQSTHLFIWKCSDKDDLRRLQDISGNVNRRLVAETVQSLEWENYECLYINARTGEIVITSSPNV